MPDNSHFKNLDLLSNMADRSLENFTEWGFTYFVKLYDPSQVETMEKDLAEVTRSYERGNGVDQFGDCVHICDIGSSAAESSIKSL